MLVTGAGGFLGRAICARLRGRANVIALDIAKRPPSWQGRWIEASVSSDLSAHSYLDGVDTIIHAAWTGFPGAASGIDRDLERNVGPTVSLYLRGCSAGVQRFVFLSSGGTVYGNAARVPISEDSLLAPVSLYGASKAGVEAYLGALQHTTGVKPTILRLANPFGPGQLPWRGQGVISTAIGCALTGTEFTVWGDGEAVRDYIYVDDTAAAIVEAAVGDGPTGVYNVGSGIGRSLNDVLLCVEEALGQKLTLTKVPVRGVDVASNVLNIDKAKQAYSWSPLTSFEEGIMHCCQWMDGNRSIWQGARPSARKKDFH